MAAHQCSNDDIDHQPKLLYLSCMHFVTMNINNYKPCALEALAPLIKSQLLLNVTIHGNIYGHCSDLATIRSLLQLSTRHLDLSHCTDVTDEMMQDIARLSPNLLELKISAQLNHRQITSECLRECIPKLRHITVLQMSSLRCINDDVLEAILTGCPDIEKLDISNYSDVTYRIAGLIRGFQMKGLIISPKLRLQISF